MDTIEFLHTVGKLKETMRTGWVETGVQQPESVSDHMYRAALLCMMCPDSSLNRDRLVRMALCHDVGESIIGDISPKMGVPAAEKHKREKEAILHLRGLLPHDSPLEKELQELWEEYETQGTPEARFLRDIDLLEMVTQAHAYEKTHPELNFDSFYVSGEKIKHPWVRSIYDNLVSTRPSRKS
ncbi:hypothetical protein, conserved [Trypanosoma brucei gambiense DAL972]|uniref:5'-deoxynucleotidase n=2 Tax=Trypanosoma brucei TaxID=5691 RepID=C9ZYR1_TRYB9|nr:hypothetical protein, conserved [Trypanosoma brucei gambiense DAL972]RHW70266.1 HD domain containing protein [Trypanosoma brucei equiperdum]CBH14560.1 hypothetical protein, conserved [Trypanosoma brucei gambiense DAL972]|eukprot:XP_011776826.1 hypothetical protein, conserved [Trypanosoma brucei gambiense DAL972]